MTTGTTTPTTTAVFTVPERSVGRGGGGMGRDTLASNVTDTGRCHTVALLDLQLISKQRVTNNNTHTFHSLDDCSIAYHYQLTIKCYELPINGSPFINNNRRYMFPVSANVLFSVLYRINFITGIPMASCVQSGSSALVLSVTLHGQIMYIELQLLYYE